MTANRAQRRAYERQNKLSARAKERMIQRGLGSTAKLSHLPRFGSKASSDRRSKR